MGFVAAFSPRVYPRLGGHKTGLEGGKYVIAWTIFGRKPTFELSPLEEGLKVSVVYSVQEGS